MLVSAIPRSENDMVGTPSKVLRRKSTVAGSAGPMSDNKERDTGFGEKRGMIDTDAVRRGAGPEYKGQVVK